MSSITRLIMSITKLYSPYRMPSSTKFLEHQTLATTTVLGNRYLSNHARLLQKHNTYRRNFSVYNNSVQPGAPLPSQPPSSSSWRWILGIVLTIVLPVVTNKWGPLIQFKNEVDTTVETIEEIVEVVEKVAEVVDKVAESISDNIPTGGKLKRVVELVEDVAEETARDAHTVGDVIDKLMERNRERRWKLNSEVLAAYWTAAQQLDALTRVKEWLKMSKRWLRDGPCYVLDESGS